MKRSCLALVLAVAACTETPDAVVGAAVQATMERRPQALLHALAPSYRDPRGDLSVLLADLRRLYERYPSSAFVFDPRQDLRIDPTGHVEVTLQSELQGETVWKVQQHYRVSIASGFEARIRSGWMVALRDAMDLVDDLHQASSPGELGLLLHPGFRAGLLDREEWLMADRRNHPFGCAWSRAPQVAIRNVRFESGGERQHLDLHLRIPNRLGPIPRVLRLTLSTSAGRLRIIGGLEPEVLGRPSDSFVR